MSRPLRIEYEDAWYHVMNRGAAKQATFLNRAHYELFLEVLEEVVQRFQIEVHAYCLMPNHYHLLIKTPHANLSKAMRHLNGVYTQRFNKACDRDGPLFRGRYKAILVDQEQYLTRLSRYIHLNPVKANLVRKPERYTWSSYPYYHDPKKQPDWLTCTDVLERFGQRKAREAYADFVAEGIDADIDKFYTGSMSVPILGGKQFTNKVTRSYLDHQPDSEIHQHKATLKKQLPSIEDVFQSVATFYELSMKELLARVPREKNRPKALAVQLAVKKAQASYRDIAEFIGDISYPAVAKMIARLREEMQTEKGIQAELDNLAKQL